MSRFTILVGELDICEGVGGGEGGGGKDAGVC